MTGRTNAVQHSISNFNRVFQKQILNNLVESVTFSNLDLNVYYILELNSNTTRYATWSLIGFEIIDPELRFQPDTNRYSSRFIVKATATTATITRAELGFAVTAMLI